MKHKKQSVCHGFYAIGNMTEFTQQRFVFLAKFRVVNRNDISINPLAPSLQNSFSICTTRASNSLQT